MATGFGIALHDAGLPVGPDRCERLARAVTIMGATTVAELRACALATMVSDPGQMPTFDRVFAAVFGGPSPFRHLNLPNAARSYERPASDGSPQPQGRSEDNPGDLPSGLRVSDAVPAAADSDEPLVEGPAVHRVASATERLSGRDFTELSPAELRQLVTLMREMALAIPPRRTRRFRTARDGKRPDLRRTLRLARRTGGEAIRFARRAPRAKPRRLGDRRPGPARRADGPAVPGGAPDRLGQPAHPVAPLPSRGRRHGRRLALLRRRGQRAQPGLAGRPAVRSPGPLAGKISRWRAKRVRAIG